MVSLRFTSLAALVIAGLSVQNSDAATTNYNAKVNTTSPVEKRAGGCVSFTQNFATGSDMTQYWNDKAEVPGTWDLQSNAIELKVLKPVTGNVGPGPSFSSKFLMQYGSIEAKVKSAPVGGIVTAFIWMSPGGDEIDYEWVATEAQSAYYYHAIPDYATEASHTVSDDSSAFHVYRIDWTPTEMVWSLDGTAIRTVTKESTLSSGIYHYPTEASNVQFGLWDASKVPSTAQWAHGPVNWEQQGPSINAYIEYIKVTCA
jgi:hypothetical protein